MDRTEPEGITCNYCGDVFPTKGKYQTHFRLVHQDNVKRDSQNQGEASTSRGENQKFACPCGKDYKVYQSLRRHQVNCSVWKGHERAQESDSDTDSSVSGTLSEKSFVQSDT